jgi:hypothetical protein
MLGVQRVFRVGTYCISCAGMLEEASLCFESSHMMYYYFRFSGTALVRLRVFGCLGLAALLNHTLNFCFVVLCRLWLLSYIYVLMPFVTLKMLLLLKRGLWPIDPLTSACICHSRSSILQQCNTDVCLRSPTEQLLAIATPFKVRLYSCFLAFMFDCRGLLPCASGYSCTRTSASYHRCLKPPSSITSSDLPPTTTTTPISPARVQPDPAPPLIPPVKATAVSPRQSPPPAKPAPALTPSSSQTPTTATIAPPAPNANVFSPPGVPINLQPSISPRRGNSDVSAGVWIPGRATFYGASPQIEYAYRARGKGAFGVIEDGACGFTNADKSLPFPRGIYAAAADTNADYPGSCGRCYQVMGEGEVNVLVLGCEVSG